MGFSPQYGELAVARAYNGSLGAEPPAGIQGAEPLVGGQGAKPPEADGILVLEHTFFRSPGGILHSCKVVSCSLLIVVPRKQIQRKNYVLNSS